MAGRLSQGKLDHTTEAIIANTARLKRSTGVQYKSFVVWKLSSISVSLALPFSNQATRQLDFPSVQVARTGDRDSCLLISGSLVSGVEENLRLVVVGRTPELVIRIKT